MTRVRYDQIEMGRIVLTLRAGITLVTACQFAGFVPRERLNSRRGGFRRDAHPRRTSIFAFNVNLKRC